MKLMALPALSVALLCGGCAGVDPGGYYSAPSAYQRQHVAEGAILCREPPRKNDERIFYVLTNTRQACLDVGGVPIGK